jgi:DNA-binding PadR family transcriptional regulator
MKLLSRSEEIILITILKLEGNAYGVTIREEIFKTTGNRWSFASIYDPLNKLTRKHFVEKTVGEPTTKRGGRSKCLYRVTAEGKAALREIRVVQNSVWSGINDLALV